MPYLHVISNISSSSINVDRTVLLLSKAVAETLSSPEAIVTVKLELDAVMSFAGSLEVYACCLCFRVVLVV